MIEEFTGELPFGLQQAIKEERISLMAAAIIEVLHNERTRKSDDNLSEQ